MKIAKLSIDKIVRCLSEPRKVHFADGEYVLVSNQLSDNPNRIHPYWVPATLVVWTMEFTNA